MYAFNCSEASVASQLLKNNLFVFFPETKPEPNTAHTGINFHVYALALAKNKLQLSESVNDRLKIHLRNKYCMPHRSCAENRHKENINFSSCITQADELESHWADLQAYRESQK